MTQLQYQLHLSDTAVRAILDDWGFEGYNSLEDVIEDRDYLEELGYDIDDFKRELGLPVEE